MYFLKLELHMLVLLPFKYKLIPGCFATSEPNEYNLLTLRTNKHKPYILYNN